MRCSVIDCIFLCADLVSVEVIFREDFISKVNCMAELVLHWLFVKIQTFLLFIEVYVPINKPQSKTL